MYACWFVGLFVWTDHIPEILNERIQIFNDYWMSTPMCTSAKPWEQAWRATARLQSWYEREWGHFKLNAVALQLTFWTYSTSLTIVWQGRQAMSDRQQDVRWLQVPAWHDCSYIAGIPLLAHGLTVKLRPCQCSHSSPAGRIAACVCGHLKCDLLLAQAHPRMIQHLSSFFIYEFVDILYVF